ncbi:MAG: multiheme c-type cytochrome, partial [Nitrospinaceae bacterium]
MSCFVFFLLCSLAGAADLTLSGRKFPPTLDGSLKFTGAGSCNQAKCHGHETKKRANEYTTWIKAEIHSNGYSALFEKESKAIAKKYGIKGDPGKSQKCTVCHTLHLEDKPGLKGEKYDVNEGVTCELCHGPAEQYLEPHAKPYAPKEVTGKELWAQRAKRHVQSVKQGMWDAKNLRVRVETCVFCHYQIDGEMVQAGHPDLNFELGFFQKTMPKHWEETPGKGLGFPAKTMAAGQAASLREALRKLAQAAQAKAGKDLIQDGWEQVEAHGNMIRVLSGAGII